MNEVDDIVKDHQNLEERSKDLENLIEQYIISNNEKTSHRAQLQNSLKEVFIKFLNKFHYLLQSDIPILNIYRIFISKLSIL